MSQKSLHGEHNTEFMTELDGFDRISYETEHRGLSRSSAIRKSNNDTIEFGHFPIKFYKQESIDLDAIEISSDSDLHQRFYNYDDYASNIGTSYRGSTPTDMVRRWSQNISRFSKDKRAFRDKTMQRFPSRKIFEVDGKLLSAFNSDAEPDIEQLVKEIEQHDYLMEDSALGERNRLETLKALPQALSTKRLIKRMISITIEKQSTSADQRSKCFKQFYNLLIFIALRIWRITKMFSHALEFFSGTLKTIEGNFGSNVSSYFKFLRWLFVLNLVLFTSTFGFITLPQILYNNALTNSYSSYEIETNTIVEFNSTFSDASDEKGNSTANITKGKFMDILIGEGYLRDSLLYYGSYTNETFSLSNSKHSYSLPHAYYLTVLILYLATFVVISVSMARSYRKSFISSMGGIRSMYASKIFCSWDYSITNRKAADLKHFTIFTELKEWLSEIADSTENESILIRIWNFFLKVIAHLLILAIIAGFGVAERILLELSSNIESSPWDALLVSIVVNTSVLLIQSLFSWISSAEEFRSPRQALHVTLIRNFILEIIVVSVLIHFWITKEYESCWETSIGQEIYRFIISDFLVNIVIVPLIACIRVFLLNPYWPTCNRPSFDIPQKSLGLVLNQSLLWMGLLFAPLLAAVMVLKMLCLFYVNKVMLFYLCKSPRHAWRSTQTQTLYLVFTFLSLLVIILTLGFVMTQKPVSTDCGPFRDYSFMFQILIDGVLKLRQHRRMWMFLMTLIRPAVIGGMLIVLAIIAYYMRAKSRARCLMVKMLKEMLIMEAKDKEFLLTTIANITKGRECSTINDRTPQRCVDFEDNILWNYKRINDRSSETSTSRILRIRNV